MCISRTKIQLIETYSKRTNLKEMQSHTSQSISEKIFFPLQHNIGDLFRFRVNRWCLASYSASRVFQSYRKHIALMIILYVPIFTKRQIERMYLLHALLCIKIKIWANTLLNESLVLWLDTVFYQEFEIWIRLVFKPNFCL